MSEKIDIKAGVTLPGEQAFAAFMTYCTKVRETMSEENRNGFDELALKVSRKWWALWGIE